MDDYDATADAWGSLSVAIDELRKRIESGQKIERPDSASINGAAREPSLLAFGRVISDVDDCGKAYIKVELDRRVVLALKRGLLDIDTHELWPSAKAGGEK